MTKRKKNKDLKEFQDLIDSRNLSDKDRKENAKAITQERAVRFKEKSNYDIMVAKLMQFKLQMEEYLNTPEYDNKYSFSKCLTIYVDSIYNKRMNFAHDMSIDDKVLSKVINAHVPPQKEFLLKLVMHSEKSFEPLGHFDQNTWHRIFYKEKLGEIMASQNIWKKSLKKLVTNRKLEQNF